MGARIVKCVKLKKELPGIDEQTEEGARALRMATLLGGREVADRIRDNVSAQAWIMWTDHMRMVINEFRLDPTSSEADAVLKSHMEAFLFGEEQHVDIDNYVPPERSGSGQ